MPPKYGRGRGGRSQGRDRSQPRAGGGAIASGTRPNPQANRALAKNNRKRINKVSKAIGLGLKPRGPVSSYIAKDPFKPYYNCALHYTQTVTYTAGAVTVFGSEQVFRLNSLYDPDFSGVGHQPYGFDELATLYRRYRVNAVEVTLDIYDPSADGCVIGCQFQPPQGASTITGKAIDTIKEQPMSWTTNISDSGSQKETMKQYFPIHSLVGCSAMALKSQIGDEYTAAVTGNPGFTPFLRIAVANLTTAGATVNIRTSIKYYTTMYERKVLAQS